MRSSPRHIGAPPCTRVWCRGAPVRAGCGRPVPPRRAPGHTSRATSHQRRFRRLPQGVCPMNGGAAKTGISRRNSREPRGERFAASLTRSARAGRPARARRPISSCLRRPRWSPEPARTGHPPWRPRRSTRGATDAPCGPGPRRTPPPNGPWRSPPRSGGTRGPAPVERHEAASGDAPPLAKAVRVAASSHQAPQARFIAVTAATRPVRRRRGWVRRTWGGSAPRRCLALSSPASIEGCRHHASCRCPGPRCSADSPASRRRCRHGQNGPTPNGSNGRRKGRPARRQGTACTSRAERGCG